ncbi:MAG: hypothetical protein U0Y68_18445 [Blastocatellia bacterium]
MKKIISLILVFVLCTQVTPQVLPGRSGFYKKPASGGTDADATTFLSSTYADISNSTVRAAVNQLVLDLKSYTLWTKMVAIYPIASDGVNKTRAAQHAYNLKDPATFALTMSGTITHASTGMTSNGTTGYANTGMVATTMAQDDIHLSVWCRTALNNVPIGASAGSIHSKIQENGGTLYSALSSDHVGHSATISTGLYCVSRTGATAIAGYRNGSLQWSDTTASTGRPFANFYILAQNNGGPNSYSTSELSLVTIGQKLDATEAANLYTAAAAFQTALGR